MRTTHKMTQLVSVTHLAYTTAAPVVCVVHCVTFRQFFNRHHCAWCAQLLVGMQGHLRGALAAAVYPSMCSMQGGTCAGHADVLSMLFHVRS